MTATPSTSNAGQTAPAACCESILLSTCCLPTAKSACCGPSPNPTACGCNADGATKR